MGSDPPEDRSDEQLTPEKAYDLTENQNYLGKVVADMYDVTPSYVSKLRKEYENAMEKGREQGREEIDPEDFDAETLESALEDKAEESRFESKCPSCSDPIPTPDSAGEHDCPECGATLKWSEDEI